MSYLVGNPEDRHFAMLSNISQTQSTDLLHNDQHLIEQLSIDCKWHLANKGTFLCLFNLPFTDYAPVIWNHSSPAYREGEGL